MAGLETLLKLTPVAVIVLLVLRTAPRRTSRATSTEVAREVHEELGQVTWPSALRTVRHAKVTLLVLAAVAGLVILLDYGLSHGASSLLSR